MSNEVEQASGDFFLTFPNRLAHKTSIVIAFPYMLRRIFSKLSITATEAHKGEIPVQTVGYQCKIVGRHTCCCRVINNVKRLC